MRISEINGIYIVELEGNLDMETSEGFKKEVGDICEISEGLILDLRDVNYIDSIGVGSIITVFKRCSSKGKRMVLVVSSGNVEDVLRMTKIDRLIEVYGDVSKALSSFR